MTGPEIPESHPRYESLLTRHRIEEGVDLGITSKQGLIAQGRGEAFDYLLGEETIPSADAAERVAAAHLLAAERPVISVNGNVAALAPGETVALAAATGADIEINLFNRTDERMERIAEHLREHGAERIKGLAADGRIPGLDHERAKVDADGIGSADVVLVPLEDGDRAAAIAETGTTELVVDLNPLSRSAKAATVPIVDNVLRAVPNVTAHAEDLAGADEAALAELIGSFDAEATLDAAEERIRSGGPSCDRLT
ncbi:4-phosphopantoate--beta-alanine ligase [Natronomonas sp.]|uniref:4-phosphopantoate--beta-alanine ligase n=1 Tax=Natronomonas sp. TaxID=2184060 RepID=UPI0026346CA4|nr:4-phosphopantoate--beta-alanine ligase [Natronomonas sp.]